jgi:type I restriction enzyme S subunit
VGKWETVRLGDVCVIERGGSPRPIDQYITTNENGVNWIKIGDTSPNSMYITATKEKIKPEGVKKSRKVFSGDFLLSNSMSFGRPYILKIDGCIHDGWLLIRDEQQIFDKRFLYFYLSSDRTYSEFKNLAVGGVVNNLNSSMVRELLITLPPLPVQQQIADVLDRATVLIEKRKAQISKLDLLIKSQFIEMFGDPVTNPKGWEMIAIGDIEIKIRSGLSRKLSNDDIGVPVIRSTNMINGYMDITDIKYWYLDDPQGADVPSYFLKNGDILVNFINSDEHIGKVCIFFGIGRECIYTTNIFVMNLNAKCNPIWFNQYAKTKAYKYQLSKIIQPAVNQSSFTTTNFRKLRIPLPPISIQNQFSDFVHRVEAQKSLLQKSLAKMEQYYKSLMQKCFRGEIF